MYFSLLIRIQFETYSFIDSRFLCSNSRAHQWKKNQSQIEKEGFSSTTDRPICSVHCSGQEMIALEAMLCQYRPCVMYISHRLVDCKYAS